MRPRIIARQLSHPQGFLGRIIRLLMNRDNARLNTPEDLFAALDRTGCANARIERPDPSTRWNVVVASRSSGGSNE